jgi:hypothetical protein
MDKSKRRTLGGIGALLPAYSIGKLSWAIDGLAATTAVSQVENLTALSDEFVVPPMSSRPGAYWCWLNGDVTKASITFDLEEMKDKGMGRAEIWDVALRNDPDGIFGVGPAFLSDESVEMIRHALGEGKRLGIDIGMVASSGWNAGGSWVSPDWAAKALYVSEFAVAGAQSFSGPLPFPELPEECPTDDDGRPVFSKEIAVLAIPDHPDKKIKSLSKIVVLNKHYDGTTLTWDVPEGNWKILRFVCSNTGQSLIVPSPNSDGLFIDFFDPEATKRHLGHILGRLGITPENASRSGLSYLEFDSMELSEAIPWTEAMRSIFESHHSYDVLPFLPALDGWELPDGNESFLNDFTKTVSDQIIFSHYTTGSAFLADYGMDLVAEAGGPGPPIWDSCPVDALKALGNVSIPRGEFWVRNRYNIFLIKEVASASHIYGLGIVDAESFTTWRRWKDAPHALKPHVDRAFCEGLNAITYHTFANTRPEHGLPGRAYHAGSDINPTVTWWQQAAPFMDYLSRCSFLLRQGLFAADVAWYYGDKAPNFFPEYQKDPGSPEVDGLSAGYDFDVVNTDVLLNRMDVSGGRLQLPDGLTYKLLVLPDRPDIPPEVVARVEDMIKAGAQVLIQNPAIARTVQGKVFSDMSVDDALGKMSVAEDFVGNSDKLDFIHRIIGDTDLYFVRNKTDQALSENCEFRAVSEQVQLWDPVTARQYEIADARVGNGRTAVKLNLPAYGSCFIVFAAERRELAEYYERQEGKGTSISSLKGNWTLSFPENWGAPAVVTLDELISWSDSEHEGIRHFSGTATYENSFVVSQETLRNDAAILLDLGEVLDVAEVVVNGTPAGVLWTKPFKLDIQDYVVEGINALEIRITNMWINRLTGDLSLPPEKRFCQTNRPPESRYYSEAGDETYRVQRAGLIGPVSLEMMKLHASS